MNLQLFMLHGPAWLRTVGLGRARFGSVRQGEAQFMIDI